MPIARLKRRLEIPVRYRSAARIVLLLAILFLPSLWMLRTLSPLWKDVDAYIQVTSPPGVMTILHFAPLYCFLARVPLYLGYAFDCIRTGSSLPPFAFFAKPVLSDTGVWLLLWTQHVALCCSACLVILWTTRLFVLRVLLALFWAANPLFYAFAHCVGSETLSLILTLLLAAVGIKLAVHSGRAPFWLWLLFGLLVSLSMLTRHINGVLAALLPLAFAFSALGRFGAAMWKKPGRQRRWLLYRSGRDLRNAFAAVVLCVASIVVAKGTFRVVSRLAGIEYRTRVGSTFAFRLNFMGPLSAAEREPLLQRAAANSKSTDIQSELDALRMAPSGPGKFNAGALKRNAQTLLSHKTKTAISDAKFDGVLNETARAFLISPSPVFLHAVKTDFARSLKVTTQEIVKQRLLRTTTFYFEHPASMPQCANLVTFRDPANPEFLNHIYKHSFLGFGKGLPYAGFVLIWLAIFSLTVFLTRGRSEGILGYAAALIVVGLLMMLGNCFVNEFQFRYTLPMWALTIVSITILIASVTQSLRLEIKRIRRGQAAQ
jgi:hypothetical protein